MIKKLFKLFFFLLLLGCQTETKKELLVIKGNTMGTYYQVRVFGEKKDFDFLKHDIEKTLAEFNQEFSTYVDDSLISKINLNEVINIQGKTRFKNLLEESILISHETEGHFDITIGSLSKLWGFSGAKKINSKKPTKKQIQNTMKNVGYDKFQLKDDVIIKPEKMLLDMSANAKGYGVDVLSKLLISKKYNNHYVEIGGETKALGKKGTGKVKDLWRVGVEGPSETLGESIVEVIPLKNAAIATSGNYRNYIRYGDEVFGHTLNPKTGKPIDNKQVSVTVIDGLCSKADAYATALMAMPLKKAMSFTSDKKIKALIIYKNKKGLKKYYSDTLKSYLGKN